MKQYSETQYDVDLTLGNDEYDESYYSDADDLFELSTDDESPISRLKSLVLSIDWEITDEVLLQFNEELLDLKDIWAGETINLVYVQALEKISKYIYQNKADSHPNAIKLLLTFYYNLEKIVSSHDLSEQQKKDILLEDVKKFENLKRQIKQKSSSEPVQKQEPIRQQVQKAKEEIAQEDDLLNLKAIVLGIDWEITEQDLNDLRREVLKLEEKFSESRPKLILLQGIGTLAAYIKIKKSNAHPDAFKVMQLFYESLEKIVHTPMSLEGEKAILFPAVEKFNSFKELLGPTITPDAVVKEDDEAIDEDDASDASGEMAPALADFVEDVGIGFQAEKEAMALGLQDSGGVNSHLDNFFGESPDAGAARMEDAVAESEIIAATHKKLDFPDDVIAVPVAKELALQGVDVEEDDEEDTGGPGSTTGRGFDTKLGATSQKMSGKDSVGEVVRTLGEPVLSEKVKPLVADETIIGTAESIFPVEIGETIDAEEDLGHLEREKALKGVDVETEADDDTDELSLPMEGEELAPALAAMDEESLFSAKTLETVPASGSVTDEIVGTIDDLFLDNKDESKAPGSAVVSQQLPSVDAGGDDKQDGEELVAFEDWLKEEPKTDDTAVFEQVAEEIGKDKGELAGPGSDTVGQLIASEFTADKEENALGSFFADDVEQTAIADSEIDALFDSLETDNSIEKEESLNFESQDGVEALFATPQVHDNLLQVAGDATVPGDMTESRTGEEKVAKATEMSGTSVRDSEDEVIFNLVEEDVPSGAMVVTESSEEELLSSIETEMAGNETLLTSAAILPSEQQSHEEPVSFDNSVAIGQTPPDPLGNLKACVHSLEIELSDTIIAGLFQEINSLRLQLADQPLAKNFLQLLSTVSQHIDNYRYESSAVAHGLLVSITTTLANLKDGELQNNLELLLAETHKVLEWQQDMLLRQTVKKGDQLTFVDPIRAEIQTEGDSNQADAQQDFDDLLAQNTGEEIALQAAEVQVAGRNDQEVFPEDLKKEIAALRQTLQEEIAALRRELRRE